MQAALQSTMPREVYATAQLYPKLFTVATERGVSSGIRSGLVKGSASECKPERERQEPPALKQADSDSRGVKTRFIKRREKRWRRNNGRYHPKEKRTIISND